MALFLHHFGGQVGHTPTEALGSFDFVGDVHFGQAEVDQHDVSHLVQNDVFWLQIPENDVVRVQSLEGEDYFGDVHLGSFFRKLVFLLKVFPQIPSWVVVQH